LNHIVPKRIHIIGSVRCGKTTLAKELSLYLNVPFYELDNVVWYRGKSEDIRRSDEEKKEYLNFIVHSETWIIEGFHNEDWVAKGCVNAIALLHMDRHWINEENNRLPVSQINVDKGSLFGIAFG
jgi:adenylate kinase family enzyme